MDNRPQGRQKNITGSGKGIQRRGSGLGTGPVGAPGGRPSGGRTPGGHGSGGNGPRRSGSGGGMMKIIIFLLVALFGGGAGISGLLGGETETTVTYPQASSTPSSGSASTVKPYDPFGFLGGSGSFDYSGMFSPSTGGSSASGGWLAGNNTGKLNTRVDPAARNKRTMILGGGQDTVTIMVYMCGTDLESQNGMGTKDLQEMVNATLSDNVNLIVYTGGCRKWRNNVISSSANQIWQIRDGGLACLKKNAGSGSMTSPTTLASFLDFCSTNFPANRNMLILWDHGGGSISGYGYDERLSSSGAMTLGGITEALKAADLQFDFIGFDACLMGSLETGLAMADYADYLIASEETEPGLGWYYTGWMNALSRNTSISTTELGKRIVDDFVTSSAQNCPGQQATLSLVDLAELEVTVPGPFHDFSQATLSLLKNDGYQTVAKARGSVREFAGSSKTDQIDLVHLAGKLNTAEGKALADALLSAVKYNRVSANMTNAYGLSLYFPYQKVSTVNSAVVAYKAIGMDSAYSDLIRTFASLEASGQTAAGGTTSPMTTLSGQSYGSYSLGEDILLDVLGQLFGSGYGSFRDNGFVDKSLDLKDTADYLVSHRFDPDAMVWTEDGSGYSMHLSEDQWSLVQELELNVFADDGEGYVDLGLDNTFAFTEDGDLVGDYDGSWLAIDGQNVAYYHTDTTVDGDRYAITGRVPVLLNGVRADLILSFTSEEPYGTIAGARRNYRNGETETVAKGITELEIGDTIDFLCDYYTYDGTYQDSYLLGEQHIYTGTEQISNVYIGAPALAAYRVTDVYCNSFWTPVIP